MRDSEKELDKVGYDDWKLKDGENKHRHIQSQRFEDRALLGVCPYCRHTVYDNILYVLGGTAVYHFSCYNYKIAKEKEERENGK